GRHLDDAYHYVRHPSPPGIDPIDAVVVGPGGTWALTVAHERGRFRKRNGHWYRWNGSTESWIPWDAVPITVARLAGHRLELFLERAGQPPAVEACLIAQDGTDVTWEADQRPGVHVHAVFAKLARPRLEAPARLGLAIVLSVAMSAHLVYWLSLALGYRRESIVLAAALLACPLPVAAATGGGVAGLRRQLIAGANAMARNRGALA